MQTNRKYAYIALFLIFCTFVVLPVLAAPPGSQYDPAETLDPTCSPGDENCSVNIYLWDISGSDLYYTDGNIGIGTSTPLSALDVYGGLTLSGSDRYLNFGNATSSAGYGFRDNAGDIEYKDSGGSWTALNSLGGAGGAFTSSGGFTYLSSTTDDVGIGTSTPQAKLTVLTDAADGANAVAAIIDTENTWSTTGASLLSLRNTGEEYFRVSQEGGIVLGQNPQMYGGFDLDDYSFNSWRDTSVGEDLFNNFIIGVADNSSYFFDDYAFIEHWLRPRVITTTYSIQDDSASIFSDAYLFVDHTQALFELSYSQPGPDYGAILWANDDNGFGEVGFRLSGASNRRLTYFRPAMPDSAASAVPAVYLFDTDHAFTAEGVRLASFLNDSVEKVYIDKDGDIWTAGNIQLETASSYINFGSATSSAGYGLRDNAGTMEFKDSGGAWTTFSGLSDERLKNIEGEFSSGEALDAVRELQGVRYTWKDSESYGTQTEIGFIAQDVQSTLPEMVRPSGDYLAIRYGNLTALTVEAIKELDIKLDDIEKQIENAEEEGGLIDRFLAWGESRTLTTQEVQTEKLCLDGVCVTKSELEDLLNTAGVGAANDSVFLAPNEPVPEGESANDEGDTATTSDGVTAEDNQADTSTTTEETENNTSNDDTATTTSTTTDETATSTATTPPPEPPDPAEETPEEENLTEDEVVEHETEATATTTDTAS